MKASSESVLLIEDDQKLTEFFGEMLDRGGIECNSALAANAVAAAAVRQPGLILLHASYSREGSSVLTELQHDRRTAPIPVVVLSGNTDRQVIERLHEQGAQDYWALHEITHEALLAQRVKTWFATHRRVDTDGQPNRF